MYLNQQGFSVLMFMLTLRILLRNRQNRRPKYIFIATATALLTLATVVRFAARSSFSWRNSHAFSVPGNGREHSAHLPSLPRRGPRLARRACAVFQRRFAAYIHRQVLPIRRADTHT